MAATANMATTANMADVASMAAGAGPAGSLQSWVLSCPHTGGTHPSAV